MDRASKSLARRLAKAAIILGITAIVIAAASLITLNSLRVSFFSVSGSSMEPSLHDRDSVVLKQKQKVEKGILVFFAKPNAWTYTDVFGREPELLVKRVIAVPGDTLSYDGENMLVNGESVLNFAEAGIQCEKGEIGYTHKLNEKEIFVMGDNTKASLDSRNVFCDGEKDFYVYEALVSDYGTIALKF